MHYLVPMRPYILLFKKNPEEKKRTWFLLPCWILFLTVSCSTQKNTWISRNFHALTAHYNIYFNGNESFKQGVNKIRKGYKDDFTRVLPVFTWDDENLAKTAASDMDRASKKASKVIALHSIKAKPAMKREVLSEKEKAFYNKNEYNPWVEKAYLLIGKTHFYQRNYKMAQETFRFMINQFASEEIHFDALLWLARVYIETGEMSEAKKLLDALTLESAFPKKLGGELQATLAHYYLRSERYSEAAPPLEKALKGTRNKTDRYRWTFILGQIYTLTGNPEKANQYFVRVVKMNPPYEVTFNARINMASNVREGTNSANAIRKELLKLASDQKNKEYLDQIYFALGNLALRQKDTAEAIAFYTRSAQASTGNTRQKALSYLAVADLYFNRPDYIAAAAFYDSASSFVDRRNFKNYDQIMARAQNLIQLAQNVQTVQREDSLLRLSYMSKEELNTLIDKVIEQVVRKEAEERQKMAEQMLADQINMGYGQQILQDPTATGLWYFYNPNIRTQGEMEFRRKWGNRKLEDNWRRLNKNVSAGPSEMNLAETGRNDGQEATGKNLSNKTREFYLKDIPFTDSLREISNKRIEEALFNAGTIYMEKLNEPLLAVGSFRELIKRFPGSIFEPQALYNIYTLLSDHGNNADALIYRNMLTARYPDNYYARILTDPEYLEHLRTEQEKPLNRYREVYNSYLQEKFPDVITGATVALQEEKDTFLVVRYLYLKALAFAGLNQRDSLRTTLHAILTRFPASEPASNAQIMLDFMDNKYPEIKEKAEEKTIAEIYSYRADEKHYAAIIIPSSANMNQLVFNLINFNLDRFPKLNLNVQGENLDKNQQMVLIKIFSGSSDALAYLGYLLKEPDLFRDVNADSSYLFVISESNLSALKKDINIDRYLRFYTNYYPVQ